jgi:hypothetical protein
MTSKKNLLFGDGACRLVRDHLHPLQMILAMHVAKSWISSVTDGERSATLHSISMVGMCRSGLFMTTALFPQHAGGL